MCVCYSEAQISVAEHIERRPPIQDGVNAFDLQLASVHERSIDELERTRTVDGCCRSAPINQIAELVHAFHITLVEDEVARRRNDSVLDRDVEVVDRQLEPVENTAPLTRCER